MPTVNFDEIKTKFVFIQQQKDYQWLNLESYLNIIQYNTYQN